VNHSGTSEVHLHLVNGTRVTALQLDDGLRVMHSSALMGDLKALLGPGVSGEVTGLEAPVQGRSASTSASRS
jgi:hypothetical protein